MASLKAIRTRIASVKSTQKITRAMKLVSAARLRRAQDAIVAARPYANALTAAITEVAARAGEDAHPLMESRPPLRVALVTITSDRGLAGGFNANIFRRVVRFKAENTSITESSLFVVGKKGRDFFRRSHATIRQEFAGASGDTAASRAKELARTVVQTFEDGKVDAVHLVYNEFKSAIVQRVVSEQLLPVAPPPDRSATPDGVTPIDFLYEPGREELLSTLIPLYIESQIYRALLESIASEFGARMTAMDNATNNSRDMIASYTLLYNRARQAAITKELMEIVGGAEALKG
ncbi:MAG: ATP synthase F1 subunit gamma [Polyangia bacterium]